MNASRTFRGQEHYPEDCELPVDVFAALPEQAIPTRGQPYATQDAANAALSAGLLKMAKAGGQWSAEEINRA
jgi:hypothetical protein